jgi:hypothetical protein
MKQYGIELIGKLTPDQITDLTNYLNGQEQSVTCADNVTIDFSLGSSAYMVFDRATVAITLSNPIGGQVYRIRLQQDGSGGRVVTWNTTIKWRGGTAQTLTTTQNYSDIVTLYYSNGIYYGDITLNF